MNRNVMPYEKAKYLDTPVPEVDFALVLARVIDSVKEDPAELRNIIYELARVKLQRQGWQSNPPISIGEMRRLATALETAIGRVELVSSKHDEVRALRSLHQEIENFYPDGFNPIEQSKSARVINQLPNSSTNNRFLAMVPTVSEPARPSFFETRSRNYVLGAACFAAIVAATLYGISGRRSQPQDRHEVAETNLTGRENLDGAREPSLASIDSQAGPSGPARPLPTSYGIYAISNGELHELDPLPGRVPDQRIFMSAVIQKQVHTILPDGRLEFVAFRRELATSAPDRVSIRVIARIKQAMAFSSTGEVTVSLVDDLWALRNVSYNFRVAPLADHREMLLMQSEAPDLVLPSGRYGLVLNGTAYDFLVSGEIIDPAQCLERTSAANGIFYSECSNRGGKR